jgi:hypothetical protein
MNGELSEDIKLMLLHPELVDPVPSCNQLISNGNRQSAQGAVRVDEGLEQHRSGTTIRRTARCL